MAKGDSEGCLVLVVLCMVIGAIASFFEKFGQAGGVIIVIAVVAGGFFIRYMLREKKRKVMFEKYGDSEIADNIVNKRVWMGATESQVTDSIGLPRDTDQKALKTKVKEIWKYQHQGGRRYGLRITFENGEVVGWDKKGDK